MFGGGPPAALAAKAATTKIPVVFTSGDDVADFYAVFIGEVRQDATLDFGRDRIGLLFAASAQAVSGTKRRSPQRK
jgi:hypothetical protein